ncbi:TonB-dependent receptor [Sphingomonas oryzagri]
MSIIRMACLATVSTAMFAATGVCAQASGQPPATPQTATPQPASGASIGEIVVTAEKRSNSAQNTPIALAVYDKSALLRNGVGDVHSLSVMSPAINIGASTGTTILTVRGISSRDTTEIGDPDVAVSIDGIYLQRPTGMNAAFYDLDRVEVLLGPQGTLYGRNSVGGAVNIISQKPEANFGGYLQAEVGNYNAHNFEGAINVPITDNFYARVSGVSRDHDGYRDTSPAGKGDDEHDHGGRVQFLWKPTDRLTVQVGGSFLKQTGYGSAIDGEPLTYDPTHTVVTNRPPDSDGATHFAHNATGNLDINDKLARAQVNYDFGGVSLTYLGGYHRQDYENFYDTDGNAIKSFTYLRHELSKDVSQELRLASNNQKGFVWQFGGYYFHENLQVNNFLNTDPFGTSVNLREYHYHVPVSAYAAFGQASYDVTNKLRLTGGVRYSRDSKARTGYTYQGSLTQDVSSGTAVRTYGIDDEHEKSSKVTYHAAIDYQATPRNLLYAKFDTGYKDGGFNNFGFPSYGPETITAYEVGSKNRFLNGRVQLNASAFYYDYKNQQVTELVPSQPTAIILNAGKSRIYGADLQGIVKPSASSQFDFSVAWLHARFVDLQVANGSSNLNLDGNDEVQAPKWSITGGYQYTFNTKGGDLTLRLQTQFRSSYHLTINNVPSDKQDAFTRSDATLTYKPAGTHFTFEAFVRNLENAVVITNANVSTTYGSILYQFDPPRTYGARVRYDF